jgi:glutathione S-transferase
MLIDIAFTLCAFPRFYRKSVASLHNLILHTFLRPDRAIGYCNLICFIAKMALPKLYSFPRSGNAYKVRLLAALLDIKLELINVDIMNGQQNSPDFRAKNARGQVPVLEVGDATLTDSAAILVYLAGSYPDAGSTKTPSSYWSNDIIEQATIVDWLAFAASWVQSGITTARSILNFKSSGDETSDGYLVAYATTKGYKSLEILEKTLQGRDWLTLGRPTIADVAVFGYVHLTHSAKMSVDAYPAVQGWTERVSNLPGFISSVG